MDTASLSNVVKMWKKYIDYCITNEEMNEWKKLTKPLVYWLSNGFSEVVAAAKALVTFSGAWKSGKPWPRLSGLCWRASWMYSTLKMIEKMFSILSCDPCKLSVYIYQTDFSVPRNLSGSENLSIVAWVWDSFTWPRANIDGWSLESDLSRPNLASI